MADFYAPQQILPDVLGSFLRGRIGAQTIRGNDLAYQQGQQQLQAGQLNLDQIRMAMQMKQQQMRMIQDAYSQGGQPPPGSQTMGAQSAAAPTGGIQNGPQASVSAQQPNMGGQQESPLDNTFNMLQDRLARVGSIEAAYSGQDPIKSYLDAEKAKKDHLDNIPQQQRIAATAPGSPLSVFRGYANDPYAGDALLNNPSQLAAWPGLAAKYGVDPKNMSNENVRYVAALAAREQESALQFSPDQMTKVPELYGKPTPGPDGSILQTRLDTGKQDTVVGRAPSAIAVGTELTQGPVGKLDAALSDLGVTIPGVGRGGQLYVAKLKNLISAHPDMSPDQIASGLRTGQLDFNGAKRSTAQLAQVAAAADAQTRQLEKNFDSMQPIIDKLPGGPAAVNRVMTNLKNNWSFGGDKDSAALVTYMKAVAGEYAKLASGASGAAAPAEGQMVEAMKIMQNAYSQGGFAGIKEALLTEANNKRQSYREGLQNASTVGAAVGAPTPPSQAGRTVTLYKNGVPHNIPADKADDARKNYGYQDKP